MFATSPVRKVQATIEVADIVGRDLLQRRITLAELRASIGAPVAIRLRIGFALLHGRARLGDRAVDVVIAGQQRDNTSTADATTTPARQRRCRAVRTTPERCARGRARSPV